MLPPLPCLAIFVLIGATVDVPPAEPLASPFATQVPEYIEGIGITMDFFTGQLFNDPYTALGRPTVDTTGDGIIAAPSTPVVVVPVYGPFRATELVTVGEGGRLTLQFDHEVLDDPLNPCGIDFIVFGNTTQTIGQGGFWNNTDPEGVTVQSDDTISESTTVSVSLDGVNWTPFPKGPFADCFAPTLGRVYDPDDPDLSLPGNYWWGHPTDPTVPLNPDWTPADFVGLTVADYANRYGCSAGGAGFDLDIVGVPAIRFIRIDNPTGSGLQPEIDAVSDVAARRFPDFDCDSDVDGDDVQFLRSCKTGPSVTGMSETCQRADLDGDRDVDQTDLAFLQRCHSGKNIPADRDCMP